MRRVLGMPDAASRTQDLYDYGGRTRVIEFASVAGEQVPAMKTTVLSGVTVSPRFVRWRSGDLFRFLGILGRGPDNPLVQYVSQLPGVQIGLHRGVVSQVEIGTSAHRAERFQTFIDGMPPLLTAVSCRWGRRTTPVPVTRCGSSHRARFTCEALMTVRSRASGSAPICRQGWT